MGLDVSTVADDEVVDGEFGDVELHFLAELWLKFSDGEFADGDGTDGDRADCDRSDGGCGGCGETGGCGGFDDAGWTRQKSHAGILDCRVCGSV